MKNLPLYISLLLLLTCAKEDSQAPNTPPTQIVKQYALTASAGEGGSVSGGGTFASGTQVSLTATPSSGYSFSGWSNGSTANPLTVTLNSNTAITANFQVIVNSYTLTVSAGEGGTVSGGGEYEEGTEVTITATANYGFEFSSWSNGSLENPIELTLESNTNLEANFTSIIDFEISHKEISLNWVELGFENPEPLYNIGDYFTSIAYNHNNTPYFLSIGSTMINWGNESNNSLDNHTPGPSFSFRKVDGEWEYHRTYNEIQTYWSRWHKIGEDYIVVGEGNEIGNDMQVWRGDIWYGDILGNGEISWYKVNQNDKRGFYHGGGAGDMNGDGLIDIVGAPGYWNEEKGMWELGIFFQNPDKTFEFKGQLWENPQNNPFTSDLEDVQGDEKAELIYGDFGAGDPYNNPDLNQITVYKFENDKLNLHFKSQESSALWSVGMGDTNTRLFDFNNDEILDVITYRTDNTGAGFGIWLGNGDGTFSARFSKFFPSGTLNSNEYEVLDANNDGVLDVLLVPNGYLPNFRLDPNNFIREENNGIKLNEVIWLGNGDGSFSNVDYLNLTIDSPFGNEIIFHPEYGMPFMENGELHYIFLGPFKTDDYPFYKFDLFDIKINFD